MCIRDRVYSEQLDKLKKPVQPKPRHDVRQPVKPAKAAEPVARKPAPRSAPVPKPSAVSPSIAPQAKPTIAPPEPEREVVPHYTQVPLPDNEEIDPPMPPPRKPRFPRSGKKVRAQARNTGRPKPPATGPKPVHQKPERPPAPEPAPKASTASPRRSYAAAAKRSPQASSTDDLAVVSDFLASYDLQKVAQTFLKIKERLATASPQDKFLLLVEACRIIGLL